MIQDNSSSTSLEAQLATLAGEMREVRRKQGESRRRWRGLRFIAGAAVLLIGGLWGRRALSQSSPCSPALPTGMKTFCPNTPAVANEVNGNFKQLYDWLSQKVGAPGTADVTVTGNLTVNGTFSAPQALFVRNISAAASPVQAHAHLPTPGCNDYNASETTKATVTNTNGVCFLTESHLQNPNDSWATDVSNANSAAEEHQCVVDIAADGKWQLTAKVNTYGGTHICHVVDLYCSMRCLSWDTE